MMQSPGKTSDSSKNLPNITLSSTRLPTKGDKSEGQLESKNSGFQGSPGITKDGNINSPFLLQDHCPVSLFDQDQSSLEMQQILRKFLKSYSIIDTFPLNQRVSIYNQDINLLDFIKFYVENPIEHANANCTACLIYDSTSKIYIGALTLQDVSNMILYFKDASKKFNDRLGVIQEDSFLQGTQK